MTIKRKCLLTSEQNDKSNSADRDRKKFIPRNIQPMSNGRKLRMTNDSSISQADQTTYCLCSQVRRRILVDKLIIFGCLVILWIDDSLR